MIKRKIKICYVASVDLTLKFILLPHLKYLKSQGYEVHAVSAEGKWIKDIEAEGIKVKTIGFKRKIAPIADLISFFRLYSYFKRERFQIVHTHTLKPEFFGQLAAKFADVPVIVNTLHGLDFQEEGSLLRTKLILTMQKIAAKASDLVFSVNQKAIDTIIKEKVCAPQKIKYLGNAIDTLRFNPNRFPAEFILQKKQQLGIHKDAKVIGMVARLVGEKGYSELFEAFKKVLEKFPEAVILSIGQEEPDKKDAISKDTVKAHGIEKNVLFLGERTDMEELYSLMDVFVLPSYREGLPYTLLEASSMERPIIASNVGGCPEVVEDRKTGILIPSKSSEKLAEALIHVLSNPDAALTMGKNARVKVINEFNKDKIFEKLETEYQRLIQANLPLLIEKFKVCYVSSVDMTLKFMLLNQLKYLKSQGYEVHAVSAEGKWIKDIEAEGIKVKTIGFKRKIAPIADLISFFRLYVYFKKEKFHIVHTHTLKAELYGQLAAKFADVPVILNTLHGFFYGDESSHLKKTIFMNWDRFSSLFSDLVLSISKEIIRFCIENKITSKEKLAYLGRDIDTERFDPQRFSEDFIREKKQQLGIQSNQKVIGIIARMVAEKGYVELFEAFKKVISQFPNTVLMVVGQEEPTKKDGITHEMAKQYAIESQTLFLGERTDTEELYSLMDLFVLPTHREGLGAVILEASSMEVPVVSTNTGGVPEAVEDGVTGVLVPVKDANRLAEAIIDLFSNPEKMQQMGKAGRQKIVREFAKKIVMDRLGKYYADLLSEKLLKKR